MESGARCDRLPKRDLTFWIPGEKITIHNWRSDISARRVPLTNVHRHRYSRISAVMVLEPYMKSFPHTSEYTFSLLWHTLISHCTSPPPPPLQANFISTLKAQKFKYRNTDHMIIKVLFIHQLMHY